MQSFCQRNGSMRRVGGATIKSTTTGAHDVIAITGPQKNDLCTESLPVLSAVALYGESAS